MDYEIYGEGIGRLKECVIRPAQQLLDIFKYYGYPLVVFPEVLEFEKIKEYGSDPDIDQVGLQLQQILNTGNEIGLHLHSWWANANFTCGKWQLDFSLANLCSLPGYKIREIIGKGLDILRRLLGDSQYQPIVFRNGFWIMQPTRVIVEILNEFNLKIDSTLFRGGRIRKYNVDYRPSVSNGYYWKILDDVNKHQDDGLLFEVPIYTELVPFWKMISRFNKRKSMNNDKEVPSERLLKIIGLRAIFGDYFRMKYPRKLDYCFLSLEEILTSLNKLIMLDERTNKDYKPIVLVGHSKNLTDFEKVDRMLEFIRKRNLRIVTFNQILHRLCS
ncbi:MAG: hypothetical protein N3B16_12185 [Candidatus Aminicenantes bacterium]|nr:hypothetical protein [Candidatus Aminicenantes bacterium]